MTPRILLISTFAGVLLAACGGGGKADSPANAIVQSATEIRGTAAAGLPIIGSITIKDSAGREITTPIESDGSYKANLAGMTGPFLLRANGKVNDTNVVYVSTALASDLGKTINITPFTDLIVANIAGKAASAYFDQPEFSKLDAASIKEATDTLAARIRPVLNELGIDSGFDLLRTAFAADHTKFDAVMDVLKVSVDAAQNKAVITDLVNQKQIDDDLSSRVDNTPIPTPPSGSFSGLLGDLGQIDQWLKAFTALFTNSVPSTSNQALQNMFADDFVEDGQTKAQFLSTQNVLSPDSLGLVVRSPSITSRIDANTVWVRFSYQNGQESGTVDWMMRKTATGAWQALGNGKIASGDVESVNYRRSDQSPFSYSRFLGFNINDSSDSVSTVLITGPGLPSSGIRYVRNVTSTVNISFKVDGLPYDTSWVQECSETSYRPCVDLTKVSDNASYHFAYMNATNTVLGSEDVVLPKPPVSNTEAMETAPTYFATFDSSLFAPSGAQALRDGASVQVGWVNPTSADCTPVLVNLTTESTGLHFDFSNGAATSSNGRSWVTLGTWSGPAPRFQGSIHMHVECASTARMYVTGSPY